MKNTTSMEKWVVKGIIEGNIFIPREDNLPVWEGRIYLTKYAIFDQNISRNVKKIFLGLNIPSDADHVCVAFQEMEAFIRALSINKDVPITAHAISMTNKQEEWPEGIDFKDAYISPKCKNNWEPFYHFKDPKNRLKLNGGWSSVVLIRDIDTPIDKQHQEFLIHNEYQQELVKDYLIGLDVQNKHPSLAMLYFFKVLERVGKVEYGNPPKKAMIDKTRRAIINDLGSEFSQEEKRLANSIDRWRHTKSEAHLVTKGMPSNEELRLCRKIAQYFLKRALTRIT
jgi:hypothetical protein